MASISERIAALRRERGLTQEQLGALVGVSAQAVSKWEKGGAPDVDLLPHLADSLGVSIDALFGRSSQTAESIEDALFHWLRTYPFENRLRALFRLLARVVWPAMSEELGPLQPGMVSMIEDAIQKQSCFLTFPGMGTQWIRSRVLTEEGLLLGVLSDPIPLFLLMPEPEEGYASELLPLDEYRALFDALRQPGALEALCYFIGKREPFYATTAAIARNLGQDAQQTEPILQALEKLHLLNRQDLEAEEGDVNAYQINDQNALIPFLVFARWLLVKEEAWSLCIELRKRPMMKRREKKNENES